MNLIAYINREEKKRLRLFEVCALKTECIMKILVNKHERSNIFEVDGMMKKGMMKKAATASARGKQHWL